MDHRAIPEGQLVVATARDLSPDAVIMAADFSDLHALSHSGRVVGTGRDGAVRYGRGPLRMVDGVWYVDEDPSPPEDSKDVRPGPGGLSFTVLG